MRQRRLNRATGKAVAIAAAVTVLGAGGAGLAAIPDAGTGVIHGCYSKTTGALRLIDPSKRQRCASSERAVTWDQAGLTWQGSWNATVAYQANNTVSYNGSSYLAVKANKGKPPAANASVWALLARGGAPGAAGQSGPPGGALMPSQLTLGVGMPVRLSGGVYGFNTPQQMAFDGTHLWIANSNGNSVIEVNASDGSLVRTLSKGSYRFSGPGAIAFDGSHLWIVNNAGDSVTEVNVKDGSWVRTISNSSDSRYGFSRPAGIAFDGSHLWVTNIGGGSGGGSVTEVNASDGSWVRTLAGGSYGFSAPQGITFDGAHLWVTNAAGGSTSVGSVTEVNSSDGSLVRTLSDGSYAFATPTGLAFDGTHIWVANKGGDSVTEVNASDGSWVRTLTGGSYGFNEPYQLAFDSTHLWITNFQGNSLTEVNAVDGSWLQTLSGSGYGFHAPDYITFDGVHLWISSSNSVTAIQG